MVYCFLATGFEETEAACTVDLLRKAGVSVTVVSLEETKAVAGMTGLPIVADALFGERDYLDADMLVLPGGIPGVTNMAAHEGLCSLLRQAENRRLWVAAICAAPMLLDQLGLLEGARATVSPGFAAELKCARYVNERVVTDGHIVTSQSPGTSIEFAVALIACLLGREAAQQVKKEILAAF